MKLNFERKALSYDTVGAMNEINELIDMCVDELSWKFQELLIKEIYAHGNGSRIMKDEAVRHVKEISRKINGGILELEVGVEENFGNEQALIRTRVVLFGNQAEGPLHEKPGVATWKKHVAYRSIPDPDTRDVTVMLPGFDQTDVSEKLMENVMNQIDKFITAFLKAVADTMKYMDWSAYLK